MPRMDYFPGHHADNHQHLLWLDRMDWRSTDMFVQDEWGRLLLAPHVVDWMTLSMQDGWKAEGQRRTGMLVKFVSRSDAMLFKLRWDQP